MRVCTTNETHPFRYKSTKIFTLFSQLWFAFMKWDTASESTSNTPKAPMFILTLRFRTYPFQTSDFKFLKMKMCKNVFFYFHTVRFENTSFNKMKVLDFDMSFFEKFKRLFDWREESRTNIFSKRISFVVQKYLRNGKIELEKISNSLV